MTPDGETNQVANYPARVAKFDGQGLLQTNAGLVDRNGCLVEGFGLADNLMIVEAIRARGLDVVTSAGPDDSLAGFEKCLQQLTGRDA